jgi:4'-phosphopantetheinyl transferase
MVVGLHWRQAGSDPGLATLAELERRHVKSILDPVARKAQAASYALRREVCARRLGCTPAEVRFGRRCGACGGTDHGKPFVAGAAGAPAFSVSRAGGAVAIATLADAEVGVDLAVAQPDAVWSALGAKLWHPGDYEIAPLAAWTAKEAVLKLIGWGFACPMTDVRLAAGGTWTMADPPASGFVEWTELDADLLCAVATERPAELVTAV